MPRCITTFKAAKESAIVFGNVSSSWRPPIKIPDGVIYEVLDGEAVILKVDGGIYYKLNPTGTFIWETFRDGADEAAAASALAGKYGLTPDKAAQSVSTFVEQLSDIGLLASA